MHLARHMSWLAVILLIGPGCQSSTTSHEAEWYVFGTLVQLSIHDAPAERIQPAVHEIEQRFQQMHRDWHAWESGELTAINAAFNAGTAITASLPIIEMIRQAQGYETASGGCFNPAIGGLIHLWGFHTSEFPILGPPPASQLIEQWLLQQPSTLDIRIEGNTVESANPAVQLDFGGLAKGLAVQSAIDILSESGINNAIVNAGGDLQVIGQHGDRAWKVAIRNPFGGLIGGLEVRSGEAVFTSGNYERFRLDESRRYPHIIDPRTGWPVQDVSSVTVVTRDAVLADAAATALTVAGPTQWQAIARKMNLDQVMLINESGEITMTSQLHGRIQFEPGVDAKVVSL